MNQIIAVEKGAKSKAFAAVTEAHQVLQKSAVLAGISRTYQPADEDGEQYPPESTKVQVKAEELASEVSAILVEPFDVTATKGPPDNEVSHREVLRRVRGRCHQGRGRSGTWLCGEDEDAGGGIIRPSKHPRNCRAGPEDWANAEATADVEVDGEVIVAAAPVTYLLFLEKQLVDLHTFVKKLPVLDPSESWTFDQASDCFATDQVQTTKTKKVPRNHVKAEATKEHPAQVEVYDEDIVVGHWRMVKFSGAVTAQRANELLERVEKLQRAVKFAREEANGREVEKREVGKRVFDYVFAG